LRSLLTVSEVWGDAGWIMFSGDYVRHRKSRRAIRRRTRHVGRHLKSRRENRRSAVRCGVRRLRSCRGGRSASAWANTTRHR
jgi:hypothetical protein